jgi:hypothetical protein
VNMERSLSEDQTPLVPIGRPNYDRELDAPRLQETGGHGITIHGRNEAGDYLIQVFGINGCFIRRQTAKTPDDLLTYYHLLVRADVHNIAWIEIGDEPF